jgi:transposase|tara:strand:- start:2917 stop:3273 length:357 start_codon:yes stop_codon:yes gene_type:complete
MRPDPSVTQIYLHRTPVDFRQAIDGLSAIVEAQMKLDPFAGALYVFCNRRRNRLKMLFWDKTGFCLVYKRLEKQKFHWPVHLDDDVISLSREQLNWLLDGYNLKLLTPHQTLNYSTTI